MRSSTHPAFPSIDQTKRSAASYHPTPAEVAYAADKGRLSQEYVHGVLTGQETLATFETHYRTFMIKWNLGNVANLHTALTRSTTRLLSGRPVASLCPSLSSSSSLSANGTTASCPVYAAQFPEENWNWCGPATLATTLVEDSWAWPGTNQYSGYTLSYDAY